MGKVSIANHDTFITYRPDFLEATLPPPEEICFDQPSSVERMTKGDGVVTVGFVPNRKEFSRPCARFSYLKQPLKEAGSYDHVIPEDYARFLPTLTMIANCEFSRSPRAVDKKANLIIEKIAPDEDYPAGEWHQHQEGDPPSANHVYTISDKFTTIVQTRAKPDDEYRKLEPYEVALMTGYNIHRADRLPKGTERTFLRVVYEAP